MPTRRIRVCLLDLPALLTDMVLSEFGDDTEFELMIRRSASVRLPPGAAVDALLTTRGTAAMERLLLQVPRMQAFVIGRGSRTVNRLCLRLVQEDLGELSLSELAAAIKAAVPSPRRPAPTCVRGRSRRRVGSL